MVTILGQEYTDPNGVLTTEIVAQIVSGDYVLIQANAIETINYAKMCKGYKWIVRSEYDIGFALIPSAEVDEWYLYWGGESREIVGDY